MAYTIYNNDGTVLSTIAVGEVDSYSTSLDLVGKNVNNYGEFINNNFVKLLTSFASSDTESPRSPQVGQLWFDKTAKRLKVYDGTDFQPTYGSNVSGVEPVSTSTGDFWFDTVNNQLKVWNGTTYKLIGPAASSLLGKFGVEPSPWPIVDANSKVPQKAGLLYSYGRAVGILTTASFLMDVSSSTIFMNRASTNNIVKGLTVFENIEVKNGSVFVEGLDLKNQPDKGLSAYWDIGVDGYYTATTTTSSFGLSNPNYTVYVNSNRTLRDYVLPVVFPTNQFPVGSEVSVFCKYFNTTTVRKFVMDYSTSLPGDPPKWNVQEKYNYSWTATSTSTAGQVTWLWAYNTVTNIVPLP